MPGKPPGSNVGLYIDTAEPVQEADIIQVVPSGRCYRVTSVRVQQRGMWEGRQHLRAIVQEPDFVPDEDEHVIQIVWYSRNRKRAS